MKVQIKIGDKKTLQHTFTEEDVFKYSELSMDKNPIHLDREYAEKTQFKAPIVHGMLVSSLFSALLGMHLPGEGSIYMGQNISFKAPVYLNTEVTASVEVIEISESKPFVTLRTWCVDSEGKILVEGEAKMYLPWLKKSRAA